MTTQDNIQKVRTELETGMELAKCQKCGCMREGLDNLAALLPTVSGEGIQALVKEVEEWLGQMQPVQYACLGCEYCYPAVAQNLFAEAFPAASPAASLGCDFQVNDKSWPPVVGEYFVLDGTAPVAVSTLASLELADNLASQKPKGLAIVGKTETENIGLDKIVKNIITNSSIRYLIVAGNEAQGHQSGSTLLALAKNGINARGRVLGSPGKRPVLRNVSAQEVQLFRDQVQVIDMIGCNNPEEIVARMTALSERTAVSCGCGECAAESPPVSISTVPTITATNSGEAVKMDQAGYFVIVPLVDKGIINVEHYAYDHTLLRVIEGTNARDLYTTIIANGWVTELSHAAYLGKELTRAELSLALGFKYVQDGA